MGKKKAVVVDVDGTIALMEGKRTPFEWEKVGLDSPNTPIIIVSGRDGCCRKETEKWLVDNEVPVDQFFMRPAGDVRRDSVIKEEIFHRFIEPMYEVELVLDDRNQTVAKWRELGLTCLQVADGDF